MSENNLSLQKKTLCNVIHEGPQYAKEQVLDGQTCVGQEGLCMIVANNWTTMVASRSDRLAAWR